MASTRKRALETGQGATKTTETSADLGDLLPKTHLQIRAGLAQLVEHVICNHGVRGSNPLAGTAASVPSTICSRHATRALTAGRTGAIIDLDGGRHAGGKHDARRHLVDVDPHRDALGEVDPGEDGVDGRETLIVGLRVRDMDRAGDAVDVAAHDLIVSHQGTVVFVSQRYLAVEPSLVSLAARLRSSISTVAVMPAASTTPVGTSSICTRTGMRCARRTQVKMGLTFATP